ncbi:MAG: hypothetical protein AB7U05_04795 [Mangrovibacterium sp.]
MSDERYLNFPIQLLQNAFKDIRQAMNNIMYYAGYVHTLKLELGEEQEKIKAAGEYLGITWGNPIAAYLDGEKLFHEIPTNSPHTGINKHLCFDFYDNPKSNDEIAVLLAYLALKSIIGPKPYTKTTNDNLIARMGGFVSKKDISGEQLPEPLSKYNTRRKLDKIKIDLQTNWSVNIYARYTRGFYVSFDQAFTLDQLVFEAEKRRKRAEEKQLQQRKNEAFERALKKLNEPCRINITQN